jgi:hypothetical protein
MIEWAFTAAGRFLWFISTVIVRAVAEAMFSTIGAIVIAALIVAAIGIAVVVTRAGKPRHDRAY